MNYRSRCHPFICPRGTCQFHSITRKIFSWQWTNNAIRELRTFHSRLPVIEPTNNSIWIHLRSKLLRYFIYEALLWLFGEVCFALTEFNRASPPFERPNYTGKTIASYQEKNISWSDCLNFLLVQNVKVNMRIVLFDFKLKFESYRLHLSKKCYISLEKTMHILFNKIIFLQKYITSEFALNFPIFLINCYFSNVRP